MEQERIMYSIFLFLFILSIQRNGFAYIINIAECDFEFTQKPEDRNEIAKVAGYTQFYINYCYAEDIPTDIHWGLTLTKNDPEDPDYLKVEFAPSKSECIYGLTLLVNPLIKDERECQKYKFDETGDLQSTTHTRERNVCVYNNTNQVIRYDKNVYNNNSTVSFYEDSIWMYFEHIFTGCYALRFRIDINKYIISSPVFLKTTYQRTEVKTPLFICKYISRYNPDKRHEVTNYTLDISLPADNGYLLTVGLISQQNKTLNGACIWRGEPILYKFQISLEPNTPRKVLKDGYCDVKLKQMGNGKYMKKVRCNFQVENQITLPCFLYKVHDERCRGNTIWKPSHGDREKQLPCFWITHCDKHFDSWLHVEKVGAHAIRSGNSLSASSYLLLPIIANVVIISAVIGMFYFYHYSRIRKEEVNLYVNPQHDDSDLKSTDLGIIDNVNEKGVGHDDPPCDDIVLLYTNSSASFMARMKDLRETLAKMCSCSVHDWHDGAVWNEVAKVDAVSWFTKLLDNGCRVVWIDTPATRSVVISNSKNDESSLDKLNKYYQIHDFRDMAFCVVLTAARTRMNDATQQYRRHFIVRFEGLESTTNVDDPFLDLSPHARYCMPQHLMQLCSDLSVKPVISKYKTKVEEDLHRVFVFQCDAVASEIYKDDVNNVK